MVFIKEGLVLVSAKSIISKKGNDLVFVKLADPTNFDSEEFLLSKDTNIKNFKAGQQVDVLLNVEGKFSTVELLNKQVK